MTIYTPPAYQTDPARVKRLAIVQDGRMHVFTVSDPRRGGSGAAYADSLTLAPPHEFLRQVFWANVSSVWMLDGHGLAAAALATVPTLASDPQASPQYTAHELSSDGMLCGMIAQRRDPADPSGRGRGEPIGIYATWVNDFWGISAAASILTPREVAEGLALASHLLGMQLRFSPSYTGLQMLRQELGLWEQRNGALPELSAAWREQLMDAELRAPYAQWRAPLPQGTAGAAAGQPTPLWVYDRNSSFVSSAREVGVGDPEPTATYQPGRPGVYRVSAWSHATYWPDMLPGPFCVGAGIGTYPVNHYGPAVWAWEPQIRQAIRAGYQVRIEDGFYWPKGPRGSGGRVHDLFRTWQARFWDARRVARGWGGSGALAAALTKKIGVATIGRLAQREGRALVRVEQAQREGLRIISRETDAAGELTGNAEVEMALGRTDLLQPGWWSVIIANSNERLWNALYTQAPQNTALAYIDGLTLTQAAPALDGDRDKPGGFRFQGRFTVPAAQVEQLNELGPGELVKAFARLQRAADMTDTAHAVEVAHG